MRSFGYSVFDSASGVYDRPFFAGSDGLAVRSFGDIAVNADHPIGQHPADYTLFRVGSWDDNKGELVGESPVRLCNGVEMVAESQKIEPGALKDVSIGGTA